MATIATGQITIVDLTDSRPEYFYLEANHPKIQIYDVNAEEKDAYDPNYNASGRQPLIITPKFFFGNEEVTVATGVTYTINGNPISGYGTISNGILNITKNMTDEDFYKIKATLAADTYKDTFTDLHNKEITASIEIAKVRTGQNGQDGDPGRSVEKIEQFYIKSSIGSKAPTYPIPTASEGIPTGATWDSDASSITLDPTYKYLWITQITTYSNPTGTDTKQYMGGVYGDSGTSGVGIKSITEEYQLMNNATDGPLEGSWVTNYPTISIGKYLRTRTKIVYTDEKIGYVPSEEGRVDSTWSAFESIKNQLDNKIDTWNGNGAPTDPNFINPWLSDEVSENNDDLYHNGDLYYDIDTGMAYRFYYNENGTSEWNKIEDSELALVEELVKKKSAIHYSSIGSYPTSATAGDLLIYSNGNCYKCIKDYNESIIITDSNKATYWEQSMQVTQKVDVYFISKAIGIEPTLNESGWSTEAPQPIEGEHIWQKTVMLDMENNIINSSQPVNISTRAKSIKEIKNWYKASSNSTMTAPSEGTETINGWSNIPPALSSNAIYLWEYEVTSYTYGTSTVTEPSIVGYYTEDGRSIVSITEYYQITKTKEEKPENNISNNGLPIDTNWSNVPIESTDENPYLWNFEVIKYDKDPFYVASEVALIGFKGTSVESVTAEYINNNSSTPPSSADESLWITTLNNPTKDKRYLWTRTVTYFSDGTNYKTEASLLAIYKEPTIKLSIETLNNRGVVFSDSKPEDITLIPYIYIDGEKQEIKISGLLTSASWQLIGGTNFSTSTDKRIIISREQVISAATAELTVVYNGITYKEIIAIIDKTDPYYSELESSNGDKFLNGKNLDDTIITCKIYSSSTGLISEDEYSKYYFKWTNSSVGDSWIPKFVTGTDSDGKVTSEQNSNLNYKKGGYKIILSTEEVNKKAVIGCSITKEDPDPNDSYTGE